MLLKRKKERRHSPNPGWLKWIVIGFVAYAAYLHFTGEGDKRLVIPRANEVATGTPGASQEADLSIGTTDKRVSLGGDIKGNGPAVWCGQEAVLRVSGTYGEGRVLEDTSAPSDPVTIRVGMPQEAYPWAIGVPGMSEGGVREIIVAAAAAMDKETLEKMNLPANAALHYKVTLGEVRPQLPRDSIAFRAVDIIPGGKNLVYCGDAVRLHLELWGMDGQRFYDSREQNAEGLQLRVGDSALFYGLDRGLIGMRDRGTRTLLIPPAFLASLTEKPGEKLAAIRALLPEGQVVIADITLLEVIRGY